MHNFLVFGNEQKIVVELLGTIQKNKREFQHVVGKKHWILAFLYEIHKIAFSSSFFNVFLLLNSNFNHNFN
jgi:hypothetical protein